MNSDNDSPLDSSPNEYTTKLRDETLKLMNIFSDEYGAKNLADMLHGAWIAIDSPNNNPDCLSQVANSMRELIEKAHKYIVGAPASRNRNGLKNTVISLTDKWTVAMQNTTTVNTNDWSGTIDKPFQKVLKMLGNFFITFSAEYRPRRLEYKAVIAKLEGSGQTVPEAILNERLKLWIKLDDYFKDVAHHQIATTRNELSANIIALEGFILELKYPERLLPIELITELDSIIAEGEAI